MDTGSSDKTNVTDIKTSQQKAGEFSLCEGKGGNSGPGPNESGDEMAPTGLDTKTAISADNQLKTTQQIKGEFSLNEGK